MTIRLDTLKGLISVLTWSLLELNIAHEAANNYFCHKEDNYIIRILGVDMQYNLTGTC